MPVGGVLASERSWRRSRHAGGFVHGFTFSHNPVTAAACLRRRSTSSSARGSSRAPRTMGETARRRASRRCAATRRSSATCAAAACCAASSWSPTRRRRRPFPRAREAGGGGRGASALRARARHLPERTGVANGTDGDALAAGAAVRRHRSASWTRGRDPGLASSRRSRPMRTPTPQRNYPRIKHAAPGAEGAGGHRARRRA